MKETKAFKYCEFCNKEYQLAFSNYNLFDEEKPIGFIEIKGGLVTKDVGGVAIVEKDVALNGIYCNAKCLVNRINEIMEEK